MLHQQSPTEQFITKSAFTQARKKLSPAVFIDLNKITVDSFLERVYRNFKSSGQKEAIITLEPNKRSITQCEEKSLSINPIKLRLIRVNLKSETEILITNILDKDIISTDEFKDLYHLRWGVEESYKRQKQWIEIENFSGKTAQSVKQDFLQNLLRSI